jgi:hypothetical protein
VTPGPPEQRHPYKGSPLRPWVQVQLAAPDGTVRDFDLLADTGNPFELVVSRGILTSFPHGAAAHAHTNFGVLHGGWLHVLVPVVGMDLWLVGYGNDTIVTAAQKSSPDFEGLVGLPFLRRTEYGGDRDWFWIRPGPTGP